MISKLVFGMQTVYQHHQRINKIDDDRLICLVAINKNAMMM